jgi:hypothetical protein
MWRSGRRFWPAGLPATRSAWSMRRLLLNRSWEVVLAYVVCALAGTLTGMSLAAGVLALAGRTLFEVTAETAKTMLVAGPLLGFLPLSWLILAAERRPALLVHLPRLLVLWLVLAALAAFWLGVRPFLR